MSGIETRCAVCEEHLTWVLWRYWHIEGLPATGGHKGYPQGTVLRSDGRIAASPYFVADYLTEEET